MRRGSIAGGLALMLALAALAPAADDPPPAGDPDAAFARRLADAKADPEHADFAALRRAFAATSAYDPGAEAAPDFGPVAFEIRNGERAAALVAIDRILDGRWASPEVHARAAPLCERIGESRRAALHRAFARGLTDAIARAGDGRSFATAWPVLTHAEAPFVMSEVLDLDPRGAAAPEVVTRDGHAFALWTVAPPGGGPPLRLYFNIDAIRAREAHHPGAPGG